MLPLVPELLSTHPFFDTPEPDMDDPACIFFFFFVLSNGCANFEFVHICLILKFCYAPESLQRANPVFRIYYAI